MTKFYFKGDALFARDVDVSRLARQLRKHLKSPKQTNSTPGPDRFDLAQGQGLELIARMLGASSLYEARRAASEPSIEGMSHAERDALVRRGAITRGKAFPNRLPERFADTWRQHATSLFAQAAAAGADLVALVGGSGSGKTILANHLVNARGGRVVDVTLSWNAGMDIEYRPGELLVHDAPAHVLSREEKSPGWMALLASVQTLPEFRELVRRQAEPLVRFTTARTPLDWVRSHPGVVYVHSFPSDAAVRESIGGSLALTGGDITRSAPLNWGQVQVVNLDTMITYSIDGPGVAMRPGRDVVA